MIGFIKNLVQNDHLNSKVMSIKNIFISNFSFMNS